MSQRSNFRGRNTASSNNNNRQYSNAPRGGGGRGRQQTSFNPSHLVQQATEMVAKPAYVPTHAFVDFAFDAPLQQAIAEKGYVTPTPIQDQAIPHILDRKDIIGLASTGTGKTAAFLLPLIQLIHSKNDTRVLIMAPTRELAVQIRAELQSFTNGMRIYSALCIGGVPMQRQMNSVKQRPEFVIGTPGRLIDLEKRRVLRFSDFSTIVLDEVDQMLDMGFVHDMQYVIDRLPEERHSLFFSATMSPKLTPIVRSFLKNPVTVEVEKQTTAANVEQSVISTKGQSKIDVLHELLTQEAFDKVLVFGRTKHGLNKLAEQLAQRGIKVAAIHGNKSQGQRQRALQDFKQNYVRVLLATDIASRGLDIDNVSHVINYDLPQTYEDYIHRIGRTARANKTGVALSFVD